MRPAVAGALVHAGLFVVAYLAGAAVLAGVRHTFDNLGLQLPRLTGWAFDAHDFVSRSPLVATAVLAALVAVDAWVLHTLDRKGRRTAREVWSGLVAAAPVILAVLTVTAVVQPFLRITRGMQAAVTAPRVEAQRREAAGLAGAWRLTSRKVGGQPAPVTAGDRLTLQVTRDRYLSGFRWDHAGGPTEGAARVQIDQNPLGLTLFAYGADGWTGTRTGVYERDGDRLTLALGKIDAFGTELPAGFDDPRPGVEVLVFERVPDGP